MARKDKRTAADRREYKRQWRAAHPENVQRSQLAAYIRQVEKHGLQVIAGDVDDLALAAMLLAQTVAEQDARTIAQGDSEKGGGQE